MKIVLIDPSGDFDKACKWAELYKMCEDCKFMGIFSLMVGEEYIPLLAFKTNYTGKNIVQFISDITSIDGTYYKLYHEY